MEVRELPLEDRFVEHFEEQGIESLYPPQVAAVEAGVADDQRVVAALPTASGKTLVAQLAMLTADGPALYVVPLRALATEKYETFSELPGVSVGVATGDYDADDEAFADDDIVVATCEKVDSAIRNGAGWVEQLACVVVDEVHLLDASGRGPTLEVTLAKLQRLCPDQQIVALSATVGNAGEIADWLDAELVQSTWRPVDLKTGVYDDGAIAFEDGESHPIDAEDRSPTTALVADALDEGGQSLVFVNSPRSWPTRSSPRRPKSPRRSAPTPPRAQGKHSRAPRRAASPSTTRDCAPSTARSSRTPSASATCACSVRR